MGAGRRNAVGGLADHGSDPEAAAVRAVQLVMKGVVADGM
jgi:hypothetical protein